MGNDWNWRPKRAASPSIGEFMRARRNFLEQLNFPVPQRRQFAPDWTGGFARQARYRLPTGYGRGTHLRKRAFPTVSLPVLEALARRSWYSGI